jgi:hypothetical protein
MELYVLAPEGYELPPGIHWYHPLEHALLPIGPPPAGSAPALLVTGVPWRTGWRYRERGYRHIYWDTGSMLAQLLAAADSAGIPAGLYSRFPDQDMAALVGTDGIHEWPVALVSLGDTAAPQLRPSGPARSGQVDAAPIEFPLATNAQHAGDLGAMGPAWGRGVPVPSFEPCGQTIDEVVLKRGSQRLMDPSKVLPHVVLSGVELVLRDIDVAHFVAVHGVEGVPPGIYRWPDLASPIRPGLLRDELYRVCMNQSLGYDAAFILMAAADVAALDDRQYREAHLAAGLASGRMHLIAYAYGAGASGMTFVDGLIPDLLGEDLCGILFTCVGVPEYRSTPGGRPGEPATVRTVAPRLDNH